MVFMISHMLLLACELWKVLVMMVEVKEDCGDIEFKENHFVFRKENTFVFRKEKFQNSFLGIMGNYLHLE